MGNLPVFKATGLYSLIPGFFLALALVVVVSLCDKDPGQEVRDLFDRAAKAR